MITTAYENFVNALAERGASRRGSDWQCPAHEDTKPSLSVNESEGRVLIHCKAGCSPEDVCASLGMPVSALFDKPVANARQRENSDTWMPGGKHAVAVYCYTDEYGNVVRRISRSADKDFAASVPDDTSKSGWRFKDTRKGRAVVYNLPALRKAIASGRPVWLVEGEKDADRFGEYGEVATCHPHGAKEWKNEYAQFFADADVTVVVDRDKAGRKWATDVRSSLTGVAKSVQFVQGRCAEEKSDASDHFDAGFGLAEFVPLDLDLAESVDEIEVSDDLLESASNLQFKTVAQLATDVDALPHPGWLASPVWPADAYGVLGAEQKLGKTWMVLDLVIAVASDGAWMNAFPVDRAGPVVVFLGEGGERKMLRRMRGIADFMNVELNELPIHLCMRVPHLSDEEHLAEVEDKLQEVKPVLVVVDPLYLAARGANGADLYAMGETLETVQRLAQNAKAALLVVHHWNKTGEGTGAKRMSGAGPAEWGRVLMSASRVHAATDPTTKATTVTIAVELTGDEVPELTYRFRRRVWSENPGDLDSPIHYEIEQLDGTEAALSGSSGLPPAAQRVHAALLSKSGEWLAVRDIGDIVALDQSGKGGLKARTIQDALKNLKEGSLVVAHPGNGSGGPGLWQVPALEVIDVTEAESTSESFGAGMTTWTA